MSHRLLPHALILLFGQLCIDTYRMLCKSTGMVRQRLFLLAFIIGMAVGWIALNQLAGDWFAGQSDGASISKMLSLVMLKFALTLTAGATAVMPYVFLTIDVAHDLEERASKAAAVNLSAFLLIGIRLTVARVQPTQGSLRRPPRAFS